MDVSELISRFESSTLPKKLWTHEAHLTVTLWYITHSPNVWHALCLIKTGIIVHNRSVGIKNTTSSGYHETITVFWTKEISDFYQIHKHLTFDEILDLLLKTEKFSDKHYITNFYGNGVLKSTRARAVYVPRMHTAD